MSATESESVAAKAQLVRLLLTDVDGVLTDAGVYYAASGELLKRFSIRDGMGVQRLRTLVQVETGIISGEDSLPVRRRAEKLMITTLHLGIKDKAHVLHHVLETLALLPNEVAYIGDDTNDLEVMQMVGFTACPSDSFSSVMAAADIVCTCPGGHGAFREFAEIIIAAKLAGRATPLLHARR